MAKMKAPPGAVSASFDGEEFAVSKRGFVDVPAKAIPALMEHGFNPVDDTSDAPPASDPVPPSEPAAPQ